MNKFAVLFIICAIATATRQEAWADVEPYCYYPDKYPVSMQQRTTPVNLDLYAGTWYEIARKPMNGQSDCLCSEALYTRQEDKVAVKNTCIRESGLSSSIEGYAVPRNDFNTRLNVYFRPTNPGEYWIIDIDPEYRWAIVGEPCKRFAWVLSRTKQLAPEVLSARIQTLVERGYDISDIIHRGDC